MKKILFLDRDGTLITEPDDQQIDNISKFQLLDNVIPSLIQLKKRGFSFVMISNQDGLGTSSFNEQDFFLCQNLLLEIFKTQGIKFEAIRICPHFSSQQCECRKPKLGLIMDYISERKFDSSHSFVVGDRLTDIELAKNMGIQGLLLGSEKFPDWQAITDHLLFSTRMGEIKRITNETNIEASLNLDKVSPVLIETGIGFFNHMLEQLAKHGGFSLTLKAHGDTHVDEHHLVEDCGIALGQAFRKALGEKIGIARYGFVLPMDEAEAFITLDLSGRAHFMFEGKFERELVGSMATELIPHFFRSFSENSGMTLHMKMQGENEHHKIEALFKCLGRSLRQALVQVDETLPSTKGAL